jgi:molecular chaperone DnaJ
MDSKGYYSQLGVQENATPDEIKAAYRKLMLQYHPDVNATPAAAELSLKINEAYEILSDPQKKAQYDSPAPSPDFMDFSHPDPNFDFLRNFGFNFNQAQYMPRGNSDADLIANIPLSHLFAGQSTMSIRYNIKTKCGECEGKGFNNAETCAQCNGAGKVVQTQQQAGYHMQTITSCPSCQGRGVKITEVCNTCGGFSFVNEEQSLDVNIWDNLMRKVSYGQRGNLDVDPNLPPGDLYLTLYVEGLPPGAQLSVYSRNVVLTAQVDILNFIIENEVELEGLNNEKHKVKLHHGQAQYEIPRKGMPIGPNLRSDLVIDISPIVNPIKNKELQEQISKYLSTGE